ncbi:MAG: SDR family oxidoreductase [Chlorobiales bacterium]|nr:SDR family oxidoreductase [Chlorobiales bacterium]
MKLLIIGATRGVGFELLKLALEQNHTVTALVRDPGRLPIQHERLRVLKGDILNLDSVTAATENQEAVFTCVGITPTIFTVSTFSEGIKNVLTAMQAKGVKRLIAVTGMGAGDSKGHGGVLYDFLFQPLVLKSIYEDKDREEELIKASPVDWVIVRPGMLTNGELTGKYRAFTDLTGITAGSISRKDVADFLLKQLGSNEYLRKTPLLCY